MTSVVLTYISDGGGGVTQIINAKSALNHEIPFTNRSGRFLQSVECRKITECEECIEVISS